MLDLLYAFLHVQIAILKVVDIIFKIFPNDVYVFFLINDIINMQQQLHI